MGLALTFSLLSAFFLRALWAATLRKTRPTLRSSSTSTVSWATYTECTWISLPLRFGPSMAGMKRLVFDQETYLYKKKTYCRCLEFLNTGAKPDFQTALSWVEKTHNSFFKFSICDPCRLCLPMRHKIRWHWRRGKAGKEENKNRRVADNNWSI